MFGLLCYHGYVGSGIRKYNNVRERQPRLYYLIIYVLTLVGPTPETNNALAPQ